MQEEDEQSIDTTEKKEEHKIRYVNRRPVEDDFTVDANAFEDKAVALLNRDWEAFGNLEEGADWLAWTVLGLLEEREAWAHLVDSNNGGDETTDDLDTTNERDPPGHPMVHVLKLNSRWFDHVTEGAKRFELRYDDRGYEVGDYLLLRDYTPWDGYGNRSCMARINFIVADSPGLSAGYVALSIEVLAGQDGKHSWTRLVLP